MQSLTTSFLNLYARPLTNLEVLTLGLHGELAKSETKPRVVPIPRGKDGKHDYEKVKVGESGWVEIDRPDHPLHGKAILVTRGKNGFTVAHGDSLADARGDKATVEERATILKEHGDDVSRKERKEEEKKIKEDEAGGVFGFLAGVRRRNPSIINSPWSDEDEDGVDETGMPLTRSEMPQDIKLPLFATPDTMKSEDAPQRRPGPHRFGNEGLCKATGTDIWYHADVLNEDNPFGVVYEKSDNHWRNEKRDGHGRWSTSGGPPVTYTPSWASDMLTEHVLGDGVKAQDVVDAYTGSFAGMSARVSTISPLAESTDDEGVPEDSGREGIHVGGKLVLDDGKEVGKFSRNFYREDGRLIVEHANLEVDEEFEGKGFGLAFNDHAEQFYHKIGASEIQLSANITVGKYAWAQQGFEYFDAHTRKFVVSGFQKWLKERGTKLPKVDQQALLKGHPWDLSKYSDGKLYKVTVHRAEWTPGKSDEENRKPVIDGKFPAGKAYMLDDWDLYDYIDESSWDGRKSLDPNSESQKVYQQYKSTRMDKSHDVSSQPRDERGRWTLTGATEKWPKAKYATRREAVQANSDRERQLGAIEQERAAAVNSLLGIRFRYPVGLAAEHEALARATPNVQRDYELLNDEYAAKSAKFAKPDAWEETPDDGAITAIHFSRHEYDKVDPMAMGRGQAGEERRLFVNGRDPSGGMLPGYLPYVHLYVQHPESWIEPRFYGQIPHVTDPIPKKMLWNVNKGRHTQAELQAMGYIGTFHPDDQQIHLFVSWKAHPLGHIKTSGPDDHVTGANIFDRLNG